MKKRKKMERVYRLAKYFEPKHQVGYCSKVYFAFIILFSGPNNHHEPTHFIKIYKLNDTETLKL